MTQRVLCLHGYGQSGKFFRERIGSLRKALKAHVSEFACPDAPFVATASFLDGRGEDARSWWVWEDGEERPSLSFEYRGLDETFEALNAICEAEGPFDGVLGFSQGAALAAMLCRHRPWQPPHFRYAIMIAGFVPRDPTLATSFDESMPPSSLPTLHVFGAMDERVPPPSSERLARSFAAPQTFSHPGGHAVPSDAAFRATVRDFVAAQALAAEPPAQPPPPPTAGGPSEPQEPLDEVRRSVQAYERWRSIRGEPGD
jgi:predicted esterase